jgi:hypothetical protein
MTQDDNDQCEGSKTPLLKCAPKVAHPNFLDLCTTKSKNSKIQRDEILGKILGKIFEKIFWNFFRNLGEKLFFSKN